MKSSILCAAIMSVLFSACMSNGELSLPAGEGHRTALLSIEALGPSGSLPPRVYAIDLMEDARPPLRLTVDDVRMTVVFFEESLDDLDLPRTNGSLPQAETEAESRSLPLGEADAIFESTGESWTATKLVPDHLRDFLLPAEPPVCVGFKRPESFPLDTTAFVSLALPVGEGQVLVATDDGHFYSVDEDGAQPLDDLSSLAKLPSTDPSYLPHHAGFVHRGTIWLTGDRGVLKTLDWNGGHPEIHLVPTSTTARIIDVDGGLLDGRMEVFAITVFGELLRYHGAGWTQWYPAVPEGIREATTHSGVVRQGPELAVGVRHLREVIRFRSSDPLVRRASNLGMVDYIASAGVSFDGSTIVAGQHKDLTGPLESSRVQFYRADGTEPFQAHGDIVELLEDVWDIQPFRDGFLYSGHGGKLGQFSRSRPCPLGVYDEHMRILRRIVVVDDNTVLVGIKDPRQLGQTVEVFWFEVSPS